MSPQASSAGRDGFANGSGNGRSNVNPNGYEPVVPVPLVGPGIPPRRNVDSWFQEAQNGGAAALELSLFIRAMTKFQKLGVRDQLSYFRMAGLHGFPRNVSWNMGLDPIPRDDPQMDEKIKAGEGGFYCMHNQYRFGTWHRVYMILFERRISDLMKDEVKAMNIENDQDRSAWQAAANRWRLPYWDWAATERLPELACNENITIVTSWNGETGTPDKTDVPNPMYRFQMPGGQPMGHKSYGDYRIDPSDGLPFDLCKGTCRHSISWYSEKSAWIDGFTNVEQVNTALKDHRWDKKTTPVVQMHDTIKDAVQRLLNPNYNASWEQFISTKYKGQLDDPKEYMSLEAIHNNIHDWTGGDDGTKAGGAGHMSSIPVAAFDPVFILHHSNVDRIMYLWQIIPENRDKWFSNAQGDDDDDAVAPLPPFRTPERPVDFYDSNMVRSLKHLHYTYDDVVGQAPDATLPSDRLHDALPNESQLAKHINGLYGVHLPAVSAPRGGEHPEAEKVDFIVNVVYNRYALSGLRYAIRVFLGEDCVGAIHTFSTPIKDADGSTRCLQCEKQSDKKILSRAQVPILRAVRHRVPPTAGENADAYTERVDEYLQENLRCVAMLDSGAQIPKTALPDVELTVLAGRFQARGADDEWVRFGGHVPLPGATAKVRE